MVAVHLVYDLTELYGILPPLSSPLFSLVQNWGGVAFLLISGICATLGSRSVRRGGIVFGCGLLVSAVTWGMYRLGLSDDSVVISFGVLHCLGLCMILWAFLKRLPTPTLGILGLILTGLGLWFQQLRVQTPCLFPLGLTQAGFYSSDYFPLLPNLGFFLLGAVLGRTLYKEKRSLLPSANTCNLLIRFLLLCGRHSLTIYLLHQPVLMLIIEFCLWRTSQ